MHPHQAPRQFKLNCCTRLMMCNEQFSLNCLKTHSQKSSYQLGMSFRAKTTRNINQHPAIQAELLCTGAAVVSQHSICDMSEAMPCNWPFSETIKISRNHNFGHSRHGGHCLARSAVPHPIQLVGCVGHTAKAACVLVSKV